MPLEKGKLVCPPNYMYDQTLAGLPNVRVKIESL